MQGTKAPSGFTIVETLIVVAVTALLLIAAIAFINGQQAQAELTQSVRELETSINATIADVSRSYFPASSHILCTDNGGVILNINPNAPNSEQGTSGQCIFLGKVLEFNAANDSIRVITVAGARQDSGGNAVEDFSHAKPTVVPGIDETIGTNNLKPTYMGWQESIQCGQVSFTACPGLPGTLHETNAVGIFLTFPTQVTGNITGSGYVILMPLLEPIPITTTQPTINTALPGADTQTNNAIQGINSRLVSNTPNNNNFNKGKFAICFKSSNDDIVSLVIEGQANDQGTNSGALPTVSTFIEGSSDRASFALTNMPFNNAQGLKFQGTGNKCAP